MPEEILRQCEAGLKTVERRQPSFLNLTSSDIKDTAERVNFIFDFFKHERYNNRRFGELYRFT